MGWEFHVGDAAVFNDREFGDLHGLEVQITKPLQRRRVAVETNGLVDPNTGRVRITSTRYATVACYEVWFLQTDQRVFVGHNQLTPLPHPRVPVAWADLPADVLRAMTG